MRYRTKAVIARAQSYLKCSLVKSKNQFSLLKYLSSVWFGVGLRFSAAGQRIGTDRPVSALFFFLKEQLERPVVTKTLEGSARVAVSRAAACSEPRGVWPSWDWPISQGCLVCPTQLRPARGGVHGLWGLTEGAGGAAGSCAEPSPWVCAGQRQLGWDPLQPASPASLPSRSTALCDSAWGQRAIPSAGAAPMYAWLVGASEQHLVMYYIYAEKLLRPLTSRIIPVRGKNLQFSF